jgi:xylulokinase
MLSAGDFDPSLFPRCGNSFDVLCHTNETFEKLCGIKSNTPISYRAGDQPNNAYALGVINDGDAAATGGTSGVVYSVSKKINCDDKSRVNSFVHVNHTPENNSIGTLLCINGTGILYNWVRSNFYPNHSYPNLEKIAQSIPIGSRGLTILPFGNGAERMLENKRLNASIHNIDFNRHSAAHIARAALEGIAFAFVFGMEALKELGINTSKIKAGNDNLFQSDLFTQTLSNLSKTEITICETNGAIGAAKGSALGAKFISTIEESISGLNVVKTVYPESNVEQYLYYYESWRKNLIF